MNQENSRKFLIYLLETRQFSFAAMEAERLLYTEKNDSLGRILLKSYRLSLNYTKGLERASSLFPNQSQMPDFVATEYCKLLLLTYKPDSVLKFISRNKNISQSQQNELLLQSKLLQKRWAETLLLTKEIKERTDDKRNIERYENIASERLKMKRKSPFLAFSMSAIIPGSGKIYSGWTKDGLLSLLSIGILSYQSYSGFRKDGVKSVFGWIFAGISASFYLSNLYGSVRNARNYNNAKDNLAIERTKNIINE